MGFNLGDDIFTTIPIAFAFLVMAGLVLIWFFATDLGLAVRATGQNEPMIVSLGVDTERTKIVAWRSPTASSRCRARWWRRTTALPISAWASASW
jgi:ABC-type uncharacterized transport system permease subunit